MLDATLDSVKSALERARASLEGKRPLTTEPEPAPAAASSAEEAIVAKFVSAYEVADLTPW